MTSAKCHQLERNLLLRSLPPHERERLTEHVKVKTFQRGEVVFEPGSDVLSVIFPLDGAIISLRLPLADGRAIETTTVGREGALGGVLSHGYLPTFTRAVTQMDGEAICIPTAELRFTEFGSLPNMNTMVRYADCLLAQVLQSVVCNAAHSLDQRCARWLLTIHDRLGRSVLPVTQELLAEILGVQRTYLTKILKIFEQKNLIKTSRGNIMILDKIALQDRSCECLNRIRKHYMNVLGTSFMCDDMPLASDTEPAGEASTLGGNQI